MTDPGTYALLSALAAFFGGLMADAAESLASDALKKFAELFYREGAARAAGHFGLAANHDAERAIRRAQMTALKYVLNAYATDAPHDRDERGQWTITFISAALDFADRAAANCSAEALDERARVIDAIQTGLDAALAGAPTTDLAARAAILRVCAETAALEELRVEIGKDVDEGAPLHVPEDFETLFRDGGVDANGERISSWHEAFVISAADALKDDTRFAEVFTATRLAQVAELALTADEKLDAARVLSRAIDDAVIHNGHAIERIEAAGRDLSARAARMERKLDRVGETTTRTDQRLARIEASVAQIARQEQTPVAVLRAILADMGEATEGLAPEQIIAKLREKAKEFRDLVARLNRLTNDDPEVVRLRKAAADALGQGQFAIADARLAEAEARDLAGLTELEQFAKTKRLSAAATRAERAAAAMLRVTPQAYSEAAEHWAEAARIAESADMAIARSYAEQQGSALLSLGNEFGRNEALRDAAGHFRNMLRHTKREHERDVWAGLQIWIGIALSRLGERDGGTARLLEAVDAFREALKEYTRERAPLQWAMTQNNLCNALQTLGQRERGTDRLIEAVDAYRDALKERTRERAPLQWAITQNNLGNALQTLGERESGTARLLEAVVAYRDALKERTRERAPLQWATTQNNLGNALQTLGEREGGTARLLEAVDAYRDALTEYTRERVPLDWAMTLNNLGNALETLGERESGTARLAEAVDTYAQALKELTPQATPHHHPITRENLARAEALLAERRKGRKK